MTKQYQLLIFDWDGTLMDSAADIVANISAAIKHTALPARTDAQLRNIIGLGIMEGLEQLYPGESQAALIELQNAFKQNHFKVSASPSPLFPGTKNMLKKLNESGYWLAVATGKSKRGLKKALADHDITHLFHTTRTAEETCSKPHPQMLHEIIEELDITAAQALMIGDTTYDLEMAQNANMDAVSLGCGAHTLAQLDAFSRIAHFDYVTDVVKWLERHSTKP